MRVLQPSLALTLLATTTTRAWAWETVDDAVEQAAARLFDPTIFGVGTFASKYPSNHTVEDLQGEVVASPDYYAPCFANGDLLMIAMPVSQHWRNALVSPRRNATFSIGSNPDPAVPDPRHLASHERDDGMQAAEDDAAPADGHGDASKRHGQWDPSRPNWRRGMPSKARMTLFGHIERLSGDTEVAASSLKTLGKCFLSYHPDSAHWAPGAADSPHTAFWARFAVDRVYHVGGFGDEHFIGFLPLDKYRQAAREQFLREHMRLQPPSVELTTAAESSDVLFAPWDAAAEADPASFVVQG